MQELIAAGFDVRVFEDEGEPHLLRTRRADCTVDFIVAGTEYQHVAIERARGHVLTVEHEYVDHSAREWAVEDRWREALRWRG